MKPLNILILGATGRTGQYLVREALDRGHTVHALVRNPEKLKISSDQLVIKRGTPEYREDLETALKDCDAVLSALNISRKSDFPWSNVLTPPNFLSEVMQNVVDLASQVNLKRVIVVTAAGVGDSAIYTPGWFRWIINHSNIGVTYKDHERQEQVLINSQLLWTIVRPTGLSNSEKDKPVRVAVPGVEKPGFRISRKNVARFMIDILEQDQYICKKPTISE